MMILPKNKDATHRAWMYRVLVAIADNTFLARHLRFKGGTCAAMRGFLDRFSVDLDFDFVGDRDSVEQVDTNLVMIFNRLGLAVKDRSESVPQFFLKYPSVNGERNTLKVDVNIEQISVNKYEPVSLMDIDRILYCQTKETMFANKLVAIVDRYEKHGSIAGRDVYDIHYFFMRGFLYDEHIIEERRGVSAKIYIAYLADFIKKNITATIIDHDLNVLLPNEQFHRIRGVLKEETIRFLRDK